MYSSSETLQAAGAERSGHSDRSEGVRGISRLDLDQIACGAGAVAVAVAVAEVVAEPEIGIDLFCHFRRQTMHVKRFGCSPSRCPNCTPRPVQAEGSPKWPLVRHPPKAARHDDAACCLTPGASRASGRAQARRSRRCARAITTADTDRDRIVSRQPGPWVRKGRRPNDRAYSHALVSKPRATKVCETAGAGLDTSRCGPRRYSNAQRSSCLALWKPVCFLDGPPCLFAQPVLRITAQRPAGLPGCRGTGAIMSVSDAGRAAGIERTFFPNASGWLHGCVSARPPRSPASGTSFRPPSSSHSMCRDRHGTCASARSGGVMRSNS